MHCAYNVCACVKCMVEAKQELYLGEVAKCFFLEQFFFPVSGQNNILVKCEFNMRVTHCMLYVISTGVKLWCYFISQGRGSNKLNLDC